MTDPTVKKKAGETPRSPVGRKGVLDVAARLFRDRGYGSVSLRKIAEAAGIKAGSIYYHFGSKDEIVVAIKERMPGSRVHIHVEPCDYQCKEACLEGCSVEEETRNNGRAKAPPGS